jgi:glyoxylase-like metal-dependent hydrolase (beta-lactamase superfamily II)
VLCLSLVLAACSGEAPPPADTPTAEQATPTVAELVDGLITAMGGRAALESVAVIVREGSGTRGRMGQIAMTGGDDPTGGLGSITETIDLANGRAAMDYDVMIGDFTMHRTEVLTEYDGERVGVTTGPGRPNSVTSANGIFSWGTQNSPEWLLRRNVVSIALAAADSATDTAAVERPFNGSTSLFGTVTIADEEIGLYFDVDTGLLDGYSTLDTEVMLGDVDAEYVLADWRATGDLMLPHRITIRKDNAPYSSAVYTSITLNPESTGSLFEIPGDVREQADAVVASNTGWAPISWNRVTTGVYHAVGYSHHSMVVEFPTFVAVIEAPYTEAQSQRLRQIIDAELDKPIRYVVPTHPHYDHTGGIRGLAAAGAAIVVAQGHESELRGIVESPHTNPPDELSQRERSGGEVGTLEAFSGMTTIEEGTRTLELYEVSTIPHVNPKTLAFVPDAGVLFQSDLLFAGPGPDATALYETITDLGLEVRQIVGGHGGVVSFGELADMAAQ